MTDDDIDRTLAPHHAAPLPNLSYPAARRQKIVPIYIQLSDHKYNVVYDGPYIDESDCVTSVLLASALAREGYSTTDRLLPPHQEHVIEAGSIVVCSPDHSRTVDDIAKQDRHVSIMRENDDDQLTFVESTTGRVLARERNEYGGVYVASVPHEGGSVLLVQGTSSMVAMCAAKYIADNLALMQSEHFSMVLRVDYSRRPEVRVVYEQRW